MSDRITNALQYVTPEERRLTAAAVNSYARLAARIGCDPLKLAESDVLGLLWAAAEESATASQLCSRIEEAMELARRCRQTEAQP